MKKIEKILKRQAKILKDSFSDKMSVYRSSYMKNEIGETKFSKNLIYENVPCYLSISTMKSPDKMDVTKGVVNDYIIFTGNEVFLEDNDEVLLKRYDATYKGKASKRYDATYKGKASKSYNYDTHNETTLKVEERV